MTDVKVKSPWHVWLIGIIAVLFNSIGVFDFVMSMAQGAGYQASVGMTPEQIAHYQRMPSWMFVVWAVGVFGAFLASILLLMRRKQASPVFLLSLAAFVVKVGVGAGEAGVDGEFGAAAAAEDAEGVGGSGFDADVAADGGAVADRVVFVLRAGAI